MARPHNLLPPYVKHLINDAKVEALPRYPDKEITIYLYETNQTIRTINETPKDTALVIQSKLKQSIKFHYSNQSLALTTRQFENPADSAYWLNQIQGYIYEQLNISPLLYSYITINLDSTETIGQSQKFRLVRNAPLAGPVEARAYEILGVQESIKSFPSFDKSQWELVDEISLKDKIIRIQISFEKGTLLSPNGIRIFTKENLDEQVYKRNMISLINSSTNNFQSSFINFYQTNPLAINFLSQNELINRSWKIGNSNQNNILSFTSNRNNEIPKAYIENNKLYITASEHLRHRFIDPKYKYFDSDKTWIDENLKKGYDWTKNSKTIIDILNGQYYEPETKYLYPEIVGKLPITNKINSFKDLDYDKLPDRQFFMLSEHFNLMKNFLSWDSSSIGDIKVTTDIYWKTLDHNFTNANKETWQQYFDDEMFLDIKLTTAGFSPQIILKQIFSSWVKLVIFNDEDKKIFSGTFNTNNSFDDSNYATTIQF